MTAVDRTGQTWAQDMHPVDGVGTLTFVVVGPPREPYPGKASHPIVVLDASGGNWRRDLVPGLPNEFDEQDAEWERRGREYRLRRIS